MTVRHYIPLVKTFALVIGLCCTLLLTTVEGEPTRHVKFLVVGAGPAGIQAAYFLDKYNMDYVVLERADHPGSFFDEFPRSRTLTSTNKRHHAAGTSADARLRHDQHSLLHEPVDAADALLFGDVAGDAYHPSASSVPLYLSAFVERHGLEVLYSHTVVSVSRASASAPFHVRYHDGSSGSDGELTADVVLMGTGLRPFKPTLFSGSEHVEWYDTMSWDAEKYIDKEVIVFGGGNAAFEIADMLEDVTAHTHMASSRPPRYAFETHYVGDVRAQYLNLFDKYQLKSLDAVMMASRAEDISVNANVPARDPARLFVRYQNDTSYDLVGPTRNGYHHVFMAFGWEAAGLDILAPDLQPRVHNRTRLPVTTSMFESSNVQGLFFIGALMHARDYAVGSGGHVHGFRYLIRTLVRHLRDGRKMFSSDSGGFALSQRLRTTSSLWNNAGVLCDVLRSGGAVYYDVPCAYVVSPLLLSNNINNKNDTFSNSVLKTLSLEFGDKYHGIGVMLKSGTRSDLPNCVLQKRSVSLPWEEDPDEEYYRRFVFSLANNGTHVDLRPPISPREKRLGNAEDAEDDDVFGGKVTAYAAFLRQHFPPDTTLSRTLFSDPPRLHPVLRTYKYNVNDGSGVWTLVESNHLPSDELGLWEREADVNGDTN
eukprot:PhM_4_TR4107/c0_g4_i3/m.14952